MAKKSSEAKTSKNVEKEETIEKKVAKSKKKKTVLEAIGDLPKCMPTGSTGYVK